MLVHADRRNYATALITLDPDALAQWGRARGLTATDYAALAADPAVRGYVQSSIDELNGRLNRWETVKDFRILDHDLSVEHDELTPSLKIKRKVVEAQVPGAARLDVRRDSRTDGQVTAGSASPALPRAGPQAGPGRPSASENSAMPCLITCRPSPSASSTSAATGLFSAR